MSTIYMLVYTSRATRPDDANDIKDILVSSLRNNLRDDITGLLVARDGFFLQLLEGDRKKVRECFDRIKADTRHTSVTLQGDAEADERSMPDWQMAYFGPNTKIPSTDGLLTLFDTARRGGKFENPASLLSVVQMFAKNATALKPDPPV